MKKRESQRQNRRRRGAKRRRESYRPHVEALETRRLLARDAFLVTTENDDAGEDPSTLSLREAIEAANDKDGLDRIRFARWVRDITLTKGELEITDDLKIQGSGARRLTISGDNATRIFRIGGAGDETAEVGISRVTLADGQADVNATPSSTGGAIYVDEGSRLALYDAVLEDNSAVGDKDTVISPSVVFNSIGGGVGGAIANFGTLNVHRTTFRNNEAIGADDAVRPADFPADAFDFPGNALGGAIDNLGTATVSHSRFYDNRAIAGSNGQGAFAAISVGGGIYNDGKLTVRNSSFGGNESIGGDNSVSPSHNGHALGGAVASGTLLALFGAGSAELTVLGSSFHGNEARGGSGNVVLDDVVRADGPNAAFGGAINVYQGSAVISNTSVAHNKAIGGTGGADQNGGLGVGGGVFFFNFVGGVNGSLTRSNIRANVAAGGDGTRGVPGGDGLGGGVAVGSLESLFGAPGEVVIRGNNIVRNVAKGGDGGPDAAGGDGQGGGIAKLDGSEVTVRNTRMIRNRAVGGEVGEQGVNATMFSVPIVADYEFIVIADGPLDGLGFPAEVPIPVQASGEFTFKLDPKLLNDPTATSVPFVDITGTLDGVFPEALKPFTLGLHGFNSGSLENIVRDADGLITSADVTGIDMEWEQIATLPGLPPLRVFNPGPIPFDGTVTGVPFPDGSVVSGAALFDIALDLGGGNSVVAARGQNRFLTVDGDATVIEPIGGNGQGGGVANTGGGWMNIRSGYLFRNQARGRDGGNGDGGGAYNGEDTELELKRTWVIENRAQASQGLGRGGGIFNAGDLDLDRVWRVFANLASDEGDDLFDLF